MKNWPRLRSMRVSLSSLQVLSTLTILVALAFGAASEFKVKPLPLPGAHGLVLLDDFAYDRNSRLLWVPAANTGSVDAIDTTTDQITRIEGFAVAQVEFRGKSRTMGPSSVGAQPPR